MPRVKIPLWLAILSSLAIAAPHAEAQDLRGRVVGTVLDPSGRSVPDALVRATARRTGVATETRTNHAGRFALLFLGVDDYSIAVEKDGFKRLVLEGLQLGSEDEIGLELVMDLGAREESITVRDRLEPLSTETASRGAPVEQKAIARLPNNGRNIYQLVWAAPGVIKASTYWGSMENFAVGNASSAMINGGIEGENETLMDGVTNTQPNRDVNYQPPVESVEEVETLTSVYDASYGRFGGGVIALTTRSGTNAHHGTLHETNKIATLAANPWELNALGESKPHFVNNTFGATVGGPVSKNKLFYMVSFEALRQRASDDDSTFVAPADLRSGDFSGHTRTIYDPLTTRLEGAADIRDAFPGNRIPQSRLDPVALNALAFVPLPNIAGRTFPADNYALFGAEKVDYDQYLFKVDYVVNDANRVYFSNGKLLFTETDANLFAADTPADPNEKNPLQRNFERWAADWTSTLGSLGVLNVRLGLGRHVETRGNPPAAGFDPRSLGFSDALVSRFGFLQFPLFTLDGPYTRIGSRRVFFREAADSWSAQIGWSQSIGKHLLQVGGEKRIYNENVRNPANASGSYQFNRRFTQADPARSDAQSGDALASFLLGFPSGGSVDRNIDPAFQGRYWTVFLQDQWKAAPRLTLSLGLRWDYERPYAERFDRMLAGFAFDSPSPIDAQVPELDLRGGLLFADQPGLRLAADPDRNNFQPRIGAAFQLANNWVLRGGYGLYYLGSTGGQPTTGFSASTALVSTVDGGRTPRVSLADGFPEGLLEPIGSSLGLASRLGQGLAFFDRSRVSPLSHQYSAGLQRRLPGGFVAEASYSGNEIRRYRVDASINGLPESALDLSRSFLNELVPNPMEGSIPGNASKNGATITRRHLLLPFPHFGGITMAGVAIGRNSYHSLQARLKRRLESGLTLDVAFTVSKTLEQLSFLNASDFQLSVPGESRLEKRLAEYDVPKKLAALFVYDLPFGRGRHGSGLPVPLRVLISNWGLQGHLTLQSGFPVEFPNAPNQEARSARLPSGKLDLRRAFDTSLFPRAIPNASRRNWPTRFPDVRLQSLQNFDLGVSRVVRLSERLGLELRGEMLNAANRPWFSSLHGRGTDVTSDQFGWFEQEEQNQNRQIALVAKFTW